MVAGDLNGRCHWLSITFPFLMTRPANLKLLQATTSEPFLSRMLMTVHQCSSITTLHLMYHAFIQEWTNILPAITLPALTNFKFVLHSVHFIDLLRFISRHLSIRVLYFQQDNYISYPQSLPLHLWTITLPNLIKLSAPLTLIHYLFGRGFYTNHRFLLLETIEIIASSIYTSFPWVSRHVLVCKALASLASIVWARHGNLSLTLHGDSSAPEWLDISGGIIKRIHDRAR